MKRYGMTIRIKPGFEETYRRHHAAVWPEVLDMIRACNIGNYSIFWKDDLLFSYFEYSGDDFESDMANMAAHAKTREWWAVMGPCKSLWRRANQENGGQKWKKSFMRISMAGNSL
jgi:L-rhamnose mutarotase